MSEDEPISAAHAPATHGMLAPHESESVGERNPDVRLSEGERVHGPYEHGNRWRLVIQGADGKQRKVSFATRDQALRIKRQADEAANPRTIDEAVSAFLEHLRARGVKAATVKTHWYRLRAFFALGTIESNSGGRLVTLTPERAQAFYEALTRSTAVDTHRNCLTLAKAFGQWCVKRGWLRTNPLAEIEPLGRRRRGKEQLRVDEARRFIATCRTHANKGDVGAIAAMTQLLLGMRSAEVVERVVRDLDDGGRLLWIPRAKTDAGRRTLEVPEMLRPYLRKLARGRQPGDRLFTEHDRHWQLYHVRRMCRLAGVPEITAHSLRGLHSTLATEHGATGHVVASALGHASYHTTRQHYVQPGTVERVAQRRVQSLIEDGLEPAGLPVENPEAA
ncbi:MAG: tyrosine-type recombinase/integrase [Myxococcales bacterium]|nr:tyrosine-type recombinase/integrase [Myxococcales bacterium]